MDEILPVIMKFGKQMTDEIYLVPTIGGIPPYKPVFIFPNRSKRDTANVSL
jgi:hypothetical protein